MSTSSRCDNASVRTRMRHAPIASARTAPAACCEGLLRIQESDKTSIHRNVPCGRSSLRECWFSRSTQRRGDVRLSVFASSWPRGSRRRAVTKTWNC